MKPEKFHAADYTPSEVEAAKRVMIVRLKEVRKGLKHIAGKFRSADDFGPSTVVRFLASGDADEQQFQAQDAFGLVERLLHDLGLSETKT